MTAFSILFQTLSNQFEVDSLGSWKTKELIERTDPLSHFVSPILWDGRKHLKGVLVNTLLRQMFWD